RVALDRPFANRGVPPKVNRYEIPFLIWMERAKLTADFLSEQDLWQLESGDELAARYDLIVFPGHTEYVSTHEYDLIDQYRDAGGALALAGPRARPGIALRAGRRRLRDRDRRHDGRLASGHRRPRRDPRPPRPGCNRSDDLLRDAGRRESVRRRRARLRRLSADLSGQPSALQSLATHRRPV